MNDEDRIERYKRLFYARLREVQKNVQFEDEHGQDRPTLLRGYLAIKMEGEQKRKYFVDERDYVQLPIRINGYERLFFRESARQKAEVLLPTSITPFRIIPEWGFGHREFFDILAPFSHTDPDQWMLTKIIAVMGYVGKTFIGLCSPSEFGKTSIYLILDALTKN